MRYRPYAVALHIIITSDSAYALAVLIPVISPVRRVKTNDQGLTGGPSSLFTFQRLSLISFFHSELCWGKAMVTDKKPQQRKGSLLFPTEQYFAYQRRSIITIIIIISF